MQYRLRVCSTGGRVQSKELPSTCTVHAQPVLYTLRPYCTPSTCITHTLYRVLINEDQCLCFNQGVTLWLIKDTGYCCRPGTNKCPVPPEETTAIILQHQ